MSESPSNDATSTSADFVHLHLHSEYSLVDSIVRIKPLMQQLVANGMQACAITDFCNLFAVIKFYKAALANGIKPIIGCDLQYQSPSIDKKLSRIVLLCQNEEGYLSLSKLVSKAYLEGQAYGNVIAKHAWILEHSEGLIALSGGMAGDIGQALIAEDYKLAKKLAKEWQAQFPERFYIELQRTGRPDEENYNAQAVKLADELQLPIVATNDVRFISSDDYEAHEARVCIHDGAALNDPSRPQNYSRAQYLRNSEEMQDLFADLPQALENAREISLRCTVSLNLSEHFLPKFATPDVDSVEEYLSILSKEGLEKRLDYLYPQAKEREAARDRYFQRLDIELKVINEMGFASYFLIVADFIKWAKENHVPVGPGRGSGAGSLVAYALLITDLDPLQYDLLFERFLNPERVSMPDFDIDFCMEGRDSVIEYVANKYGRDSVSQIITFGTMAAKAVVRDVGRVLGHPYGFVDKIAKLIPFELGITLKLALEKEEELQRRYDEEEEVQELLDLALKLEGITRNAGKHAGGVVIAPSELSNFTAIYCEEGSQQIVSQFDKDDVEAVGLVKFDFLGLRTLTIIDWALQTINKQRAAEGLEAIDINTIPMDDAISFKLLKECKTTAVFQLESRGMKDLIGRLQPDCFEDIVALVALFRPGPLQSGMVDDFIERKHGLAKVEYLHPDLEPILKPTYGVILYQEQVMQIAQVLASYTLGSADLLRRAMGKKKPEEMAKQRVVFAEGAEKRGVSKDLANTMFDLIEKFAGYGFNKSHSAAYALISYQTAWLKAHYPAAFMAAVLSSDMDNTDKVVGFLQDCAKLGLQVLPPQINDSDFHFTVVDEQTILYGLGAIKGVGESAISGLLAERQQNGKYASLFDICKRVDLRKVNRRVFDALIRSGCMDNFAVERSCLSASVDKAMQIGVKHHENSKIGQADLFAAFADDEADAEDTYEKVKPWPLQERLDGERDTLGLYLTGHPSDPYLQEFKRIVVAIQDLNPLKMKKVVVCGLVKSIRNVLTKRGKKLAIINLENANASVDAVVFSELLEQHELATGEILLIEGDLDRDNYTGGNRILASSILNLLDARQHFLKCLVLKLSLEDADILPRLRALLEAYKGKSVVQIKYSNYDAQAAINLGLDFRVCPSDEFIEKISTLLTKQNVEFCY